MNAFDYFFENTYLLTKNFLVGNEEISFAELYRSSLNIAERLRKEAGTGKNIILLSANNLFFLKTYLGIIKSGNTCIPLDPNTEKENFRYIAALTRPDIIFITRELQSKLPVEEFRCITQDNLPDTVENITFHPPVNGGGYDNVCAEIIFTSGSTGKPKGVMISHRNLIANTSSIVEYLELTPEDRMLVVLPFYYCYGLSLLHTHLRAGGSIVLNNSFVFLGTVINNLIKYNCTGFAGVPSHFQILMRMSDTFRKTRFPALRYVTQAGGKLATVFIDEFREAFPEIKFYVMYGQTEATARLSYLPPKLYPEKKGSMGRGIPGVELRVVDPEGEDVKPGQTGEVIARGENIMLGYYLDEESTSRSLRDGWLWTGDLGEVDDEGFIYLTARKNEIIKVRGKRISPKEVESIILQLPEVVDCTVEGIDDSIEGETLKAVIVVKEGTEKTLTADHVKKHCHSKLAQFKVPSVYEFRKNLNMSPTGKKVKKEEVKQQG
ncbi:MAG TPA: AMP-binding protein [Bacteroidales bacterium]|jgi:acyl-CoA synthetase (AMP-forming)/AMP-acid ligase II|nr:AMP-binding protein [Bacteroidales bacterium]